MVLDLLIILEKSLYGILPPIIKAAPTFQKLYTKLYPHFFNTAVDCIYAPIFLCFSPMILSLH